MHVDPLDVALQHLSDPQATLAEGGTENLEIGVTRVGSTSSGCWWPSAVSGSEAKLRRLASLPSYVTDGTRWGEPRFPKTESQLAKGKGCVRELRYAMPWPTPQRYSYCFDKSGSLVDKYNWVSW